MKTLRAFLLFIGVLVCSLAFPQKKDNTNINPGDFEKVQVELQKQSEVQKQLCLEIESLNERISTLSSDNITLKELSIIKSDLERLTSESTNSDNELSQKIDKNISKLSKEDSKLKEEIYTIKKGLENSITESHSELSAKLDNQYNIIDNQQKADTR